MSEPKYERCPYGMCELPAAHRGYCIRAEATVVEPEDVESSDGVADDQPN